MFAWEVFFAHVGSFFFQIILPELATQLALMYIRIIHPTPFLAALRSFERAGDVERACCGDRLTRLHPLVSPQRPL